MPRIGKPTDLSNRILRLSLGSEATSRELRWMKEAIHEARPKISPTELDATLKSYVAQRAVGTPLAYVLVLDICTGTGCIPMLLSRTSRSPITAVGLDISEAAIDLAKENVTDAGLSDRIQIIGCDLFDEAFAQTVLSRATSQPGFDVITSNPPYIPQEEYDKLPPSVKHYEDSRALLGNREGSGETDGLSFYRRITDLISKEDLVRDGGVLAVEHGLGQSAAVQSIISNALGRRIRRLEAWKDQWEKERAVVAFL
ncbi:hypothetical protein FS837_010936 [Tulasnella sp. UAMH 9824]|nr:hypothetical protein FS837_010936 [Tulasnella sp. UAMH 9824]